MTDSTGGDRAAGTTGLGGETRKEIASVGCLAEILEVLSLSGTGESISPLLEGNSRRDRLCAALTGTSTDFFSLEERLNKRGNREGDLVGDLGGDLVDVGGEMGGDFGVCGGD